MSGPDELQPAAPVDDGLAQLTADRNAADVPPPPTPPVSAPGPAVTNEYDALLAEAPAKPVNEYDAVVEDLFRERKQTVRGNLIGAQATTPEAAAKSLDLSRKTGLPADMVGRNLPKVEADHRLNEYDAILNASPKTEAWIAGDPTNAAVAGDEVKRLAEIEAILNPRNLYDRNKPSKASRSIDSESADWEATAFPNAGGLVYDHLPSFDAPLYESQLKKGVEGIARSGNDWSQNSLLLAVQAIDFFDRGGSPYRGRGGYGMGLGIGDFSRMANDPQPQPKQERHADVFGYLQMSDDQKAALKKRIDFDLVLLAAKKQLGQEFVSRLPADPNTKPFLDSFNAVDGKALLNALTRSLTNVLLGNYLRAVDLAPTGGESPLKGVTDEFSKGPGGIVQELTVTNIPNAVAMAPAMVLGPALAPLVAGGIGVGLDLPERLNGLIKQTFAETATIESLPLDHNDPFVVQQWLRDNPEAMNKLLSNAAAASMAISAGEVFAFLAMKPLPIGKGATAIVARGAANAGIGVLSEGSGELAAQVVADNYDAGELAGEMFGALGPVVIGTAAKTAQDVSRAKVEAKREAEVADVKKTITAATDFLNDLRTHVAETETLTLDDLVDKVQGSTLHKLSPEKMKDFLESLSPDEQKADVFISSDAVSTLFQDMSVLERDTLAENLGITEQLNSLGLNANTDIVIPLPVYLTAIGDAHKAWRDDVRMDFMGFSNREAIAEGKAKAEETAAAVARFEEQVAAGVQDSPQEIVYQQVLGMLKANGFTNEQASQQAAYAASRYHARAVRSPQMFTDALDAFTQYPFTIRSHLGDGIRVIGPDQLDIMLDSIRSGKDPVITPAFAHIEARKAAAEAELSTVLGEAPVVKTPKQIADERKAAALGVFQARRQELADWLESRGLDLKTATNAQIRAEIEKVQKGTSYNQDDVLVVKQPLSDSLIMVAQRGDRATGNRLLLSTEEKAAIAASVGPSGLSVAEITATVRKHKLAHPPAQNWEPLVFIKARLDKKGKPEFMYKLVPYSFIRDNDGKEIQPSEKKYAGRVKALGDAIAEEVRGIYRRAAAGDKNAQNILAQAGWYKAMRARLRQEFGGLGDLFADALGATSPNTPVRGNWENAVDSLRRASRGDFDALMPQWVAWSENIDRLETDLRAFVNEQRAKKQASKSEPWMDSDKPQTLKSIKEMQEYIDKRKALSEARELPPDLMPTKESGAQYGFNGRNVVRAMLDLWRTIKDADPDIGRSGTAPKALNFSGNLIGFRGKATIDVWAARLLQRLAGKRRIPSMAEIAVSGEMLADASTTGQFGFGQDTFAHAVAVIRSDSEMSQDSALAKINDDDLQAVVWFIEKEVWTVNNWTSVSGEGGSFELEANLTGTAKQARVRELRKIIDSSPSAADVKAVAGADAVSAKVEAWDAEHKAELDELGEINQRLASDTLSKKEASGLKKRAAELQKATKLPKEIAQEMRDVANGQRRIDERAAQKVLARAELATLERPVDRYVGGLSTQMSIDNQGVDYVPTDADMARLGDAIRLAIYENDATANVLASKALPTEGRYGSVERSLDLEIVAREGYDPSTVWAEMLRQAQEARQDSTFLSRVLRDGEEIDYTKHRPGIEIYFRDAAAAQQLEKMLADLAKEGVSFLTVSVDGRRMPGYVAGAMPAAVGVRLQYVPEFEQRYGIDDLSGLDDAAIADKMKAKGDELDDVAMRVATNVSGVSFAGVFWHETQVAFSHQYQEKIDGLATGRTEAEAGATGPGGWVGQSVRAGLADADRQSREAASGEPGGQREPVVGGDEGSTGRAGKGVTLNQSVYHGGPRIFDRFSLDYIGTGEGAQAFGWGLYFASKKALAAHYRDKLSPAGPGAVEYQGKMVLTSDGKPLRARPEWLKDWGNDLQALIEVAVDGNMTLPEAIAEVRAAAKQVGFIRRFLGYGFNERFLQAILDKGYTIGDSQKGRLYTVEIPDDGAYLLWDKPLSEQSKVLRDALPALIQKYGGDLSKIIGANGQLRDSVTGESVYRALSAAMANKPIDESGMAGWTRVQNTVNDRMANDKAASLALLAAGIPGIKYLDGSSRRKGDGDHNYVLFDDSLAKITQYEQDKRGSITFGDTSATVDLYQARNPSTLLHEMWHKWFGEFEFDVAHLGASEQMRADFKVLLDFVGSTDGRIGLSAYEGGRVNTLRAKIDATGEKSLDGAEAEEWAALKVRIEQNEKLARAGEVYLMEGKAPSDALRKVFRAFKSWLLGVYRNMRNLQAPISPEVRAVLDRMLATDEEIASLNDRQGLNPVLEYAKELMSKTEFAAYTKKTADVLEDQQDALFAKVSGDLRKQAKGEYVKERAKIRGEVTDEMMAEPGQQALHFLKKGVMSAGETPEILKGRKLSRAGLIELIGQEGLNTLPAGIYAEEGLSPDEMAPLFGLGNGMELAERLMQIAAEDKAWKDKGGRGTAVQSRIAEETQRRLTEALEDPLNDGSIEAEAWAIVHSDKRLDLMAVDLRMLARKAGQTGAVSIVDIQNWAAEQIGGMSSYQATQVARYQRAERMAGQQVQKALVKGDWVAAFKAKQDQVYNFALYKEAMKASDDAGKITAYLDKLAGARNIKALDQNYLDSIHGLLEEYDFKKRSGTLLTDRTRFNALVAEQALMGVEVQEPPYLKGAERKHFSQMTMDELRAVYEAIKQLDRLGRDIKKVMLDGKKVARDAVLTEMEATAAAGVQRGSSLSNLGKTEIQKSVGKAKHILRLGNASLLKIERLLEFADGDVTGNGIFSRAIYRPIANAAHATNDERVDNSKQYKVIYEKVPLEQRNAWSTIHTLPELGGRKLSKENIISIALNMGNESNLEKLIKGYGWSYEGVRAVVNKYLTKEEWRFVQDKWDLMQSRWPAYAAMIRDIEGVEPPKIEAVPLETPFGTLPGGYMPVQYDRNESLEAQKIGEAQDSALLQGMAISPRANIPSTKSGSSIERTGFTGPILLELSVIGKHLDEVAHDTHHRRAVADVFKIISNDRFRKAIQSRLGVEYEATFMPWLIRVANEARVANVELAGPDYMMRALRVNVTQMAMGLRVSTMVQQVAGFAASAANLGAKDLGAGLAEYLPNPQAAARKVYAMSGEMRHRANNLERDIKANLDKFRGKSSKRADLARFAFRGIALMDLAVSIPTWLGAYKQGLTKGMLDADAIAYADKMVRDTQGAGGVKDLSAFQGGGGEGWKLLGMFYSFLNVYYNAQARMLEAARKPGKTFSEHVDLWWMATMWMVVSPLLAAAVSGQGPDDDEDPLYWAMRTVGFGAFAGIPVVRDAMSTMSREMGGKPTAGFQMSPVAGPISGSTRLVKDLINLATGEDVSKNFIKNTFNVIGGFTGLPTGQIGVTSQFLWDTLYSGAENPENILEWLGGLTFGPKK